MRPVILSRPASVATGCASGWAEAGMAKPASPMRASRARARKIKRRGIDALFGRPGLVVAGDAGALALVEQAAIGAVGLGRAGQVRLVRLFPGMGDIFGIGRNDIGAVVHPTVPAGRDGRRIGVTRIGHVATVRLHVLIVAVAEFVGADIVAEALDPETGSPGLAAPPGEDFSEELLGIRLGHGTIPLNV